LCSAISECAVNPAEVLTAYDTQIRQHPEGLVEHEAGVIRSIDLAWTGVTWTDLDESTADAAIAAQRGRFTQLGQPWEWKHYSHDKPADLPHRLRAAGLTPQPEEALLAAEIAELDLTLPAPPGITLRLASDRADFDALVRVHDQAFGGDHRGLVATLPAAIERGAAAAVLAWAGEVPVAGARIEFHAGTDFASLWGGATLPRWRGRGIFRALVARRAALAADRGFRYLQVDALPTSRPILARLGFVQLATTTPYTG
jgi:GNAT superfamily N-acetyltransferase